MGNVEIHTLRRQDTYFSTGCTQNCPTHTEFNMYVTYASAPHNGNKTGSSS